MALAIIKNKMRLRMDSSHQEGISWLKKFPNLPIDWHNGIMGAMESVIERKEVLVDREKITINVRAPRIPPKIPNPPFHVAGICERLLE